jgi:hypothetical protein
MCYPAFAYQLLYSLFLARITRRIHQNEWSIYVPYQQCNNLFLQGVSGIWAS